MANLKVLDFSIFFSSTEKDHPVLLCLLQLRTEVNSDRVVTKISWEIGASQGAVSSLPECSSPLTTLPFTGLWLHVPVFLFSLGIASHMDFFTMDFQQD